MGTTTSSSGGGDYDSNDCGAAFLTPSILKGKKGGASTMRDKGKQGSWIENISHIQDLYPSWYYCWAPQPAEDAPPIAVLHRDVSASSTATTTAADEAVIDFLPMFWGYYRKSFKANLERVIRRNPIMILGFNEPDQKDQSNLPVVKALVAWSILQDRVRAMEDNEKGPTIARPRRRILLVSPSCANPLGPWMEAFMNNIENNPGWWVDVIGVHHYGGPSADVFQQRMRTIYEKYGRRPVLITELGVADWQAKTVETNKFKPETVLHFMQTVLPWMEEQEWLIGYCWFPFSIDNPCGTSSALFYNDGRLTRLGRYYSSFRYPSCSTMGGDCF
mmetsp:Transcript_4477/g.8256  ORF Transcript_4477/g.8256 Transcript_4477/m.8256 type:complete len:332 (-) Transcript_4477:541-1536(-)